MGPAFTYVGFRLVTTSGDCSPVSLQCVVKVVQPNGRKVDLPLCLELYNHSPTGFEWGYSGSGPAQLALALAYHATQDAARAVRVHQDVKARLVAGLPQDGWLLTWTQVMHAIEASEALDQQERPPTL